jgi:hypothetical protein
MQSSGGIRWTLDIPEGLYMRRRGYAGRRLLVARCRSLCFPWIKLKIRQISHGGANSAAIVDAVTKIQGAPVTIVF